MLREHIIEEYIEIRSIKPALVSVRSFLMQGSTIKELVFSIQQHGLIQPITVRPVDIGFEIVAGHRRYYACKLLRWKVIPCIVRSLSDKASFEIQLVENVQRNSLDPVDEAEAFKKYIIDYGWGGTSQLAKIISKSEQYVSSRIQMLKLPKEILDEISQKNMKVSHAIELFNLDENNQQILAKIILNEGLSVQSIRGITKLMKQGKEIEEVMSYYDNNKKGVDASTLRIKLFKKTMLILRISLARLDSIIDESNKIPYPNERVEFVSVLMQFRLKTHSMIDDNIKIIKKLQKNL